MATYTEIRGLFSNSNLIEKIEVAVIVAANDMLAGAPTAAQKAWAATVFTNPGSESRKALMAVLAANKDLTVAQIEGANDAAVQAGVDAVAPVLVDALAGV